MNDANFLIWSSIAIFGAVFVWLIVEWVFLIRNWWVNRRFGQIYDEYEDEGVL